jgi:phospholipase C
MSRASVLGVAAGLVLGAAWGSSACSTSSGGTTSDGGSGGGKDAAPHIDATKPHTEAGVMPTKDAGTDSTPAPGVDSGFAVPSSWNATYPRPTDTAAAASRTACTFTRGDMPAQTLGTGTALDTDIPIEHVVVLIQENRSFDSYFGHLAKYEATKGITNTIESAPDTTTNPAYPVDQADAGTLGPDAATASPYQHAPQLCFFDTNHSWGGAHVEYDHGLNDGFYFMNNGAGDTGEKTTGIAPAQLTGNRALWWYDERDIPFHYDLYSTFAMADHYHSALLGPTYPNRMYLYSGTSFGLTSNSFPDITADPTAETPVIIFDELAVRGVSFNWYEDQQPGHSQAAPSPDIVLNIQAMKRYGRNPVLPFTQFLADATAGTLPSVSFIDGDNLNETPTGNDEHPPSEIEIGQQFVWSIVNAVTTSPEWKSTALFIVYDENGGIYDHVVPPAACKPDGLAPVLTDTLDKSQPGQFDQYGFRVPFVVVSPYAKKSYVSHTTYSHTSITRFIEAKWKLPALTARDANADPFTDMFDWTAPPFMTPPTFAQPTIDLAAVTACTTELTATQ